MGNGDIISLTDSNNTKATIDGIGGTDTSEPLGEISSVFFDDSMDGVPRKADLFTIRALGQTSQIEWLKDNDILPKSNERGFKQISLIMREEGDFRKDTVIKEEILEEKLPEPEDILFAIDDRSDIAEMWRIHSITCLQCKDEVNY